MQFSGAGQRQGPTPGLLFTLALLAAAVAGVLFVVRSGPVAAATAAEMAAEGRLPPVWPAFMLSPMARSAPPSAETDADGSEADSDTGVRDDLPASIRKSRPSAMVPADLPGRTQRDCAILRAVQIDQSIGRQTAVAVSPADLPGITADGACP